MWVEMWGVFVKAPKAKTPLVVMTASMIKGGGYLGARTRQPPTAQTHEKKLMWVRGVGCRSIWTQSMTVVACVHTNLWLLTPGFKMRNDC